MRAVLISLPLPGEGELPRIGGKTIAERQILFARQCDCEQVIAYGGGTTADAIALRHAAEAAGMRYRMVSNTHAVDGAIEVRDELLVLQPGLLPEASQSLELLKADGIRMLIVSAGPGTAAGFERIDLDRAWAGAMILPGAWLADLAALPADAAPHAALLRIALQRRLQEVRISDGLLDEGRWLVLRDAEIASLRERSWLRANLGDVSPASVSRWIATKLTGRFGSALTSWRKSGPALLLLSVVLLGCGIALGVSGRPVAGFGVIALAVPASEMFLSLSRLRAAPFGTVGRLAWVRSAVDLALLVTALASIDSLLFRIAFPPLVLIVALWLLDRAAESAWVEPMRDRMIVAASLAIVSAAATPEIAIMFAGLAILATNLVRSVAKPG